MTDNVHYLPTYEPPQADPDPPAPLVARVVLHPPEPAPAPAITPLGVVLAVLVAVVTFMAVAAVVG